MAMLVLTGLLMPALSSAQGDHQRLLSPYAAPYQHYVEGGDGKGSSYQTHLQDSMANMDQYGTGARSGGGYENHISSRYSRNLGEPLPSAGEQSDKPPGAEHQQVSFAGKEVSTSGTSDKAGFLGYLDFAMHSQGFGAGAGDYEKYLGPYPESARHADADQPGASEQRAEAATSLGLAARQTGSGLAELSAEDQEQQIQRLNSELASERAHLKKELETEKQRLRQELADAEQGSVQAHAGYEDAGGPVMLATIPVGKKPLLVGAGTLAAGMLLMTFAAVRRLWFQHHLLLTEVEEHLLYVEAPLDAA